MTRKFPRNPLEDLFEGIDKLRKDVDQLTNNKEATLPFRDVNNLPPGIEGQVVLADSTPSPVVVTFAPLIFTAFATDSVDYPSHYKIETDTGLLLELYESNELYPMHRISWKRDRSYVFLEGIATGVTVAYDAAQTWGLWKINLDAFGFTRLITLAGYSTSSGAESFAPAFMSNDTANKFIEMPDGTIKVLRGKYETSETHGSGSNPPPALYVYDNSLSTTVQIVSPGDFITEYRYGALGIGAVSENCSKVVVVKSNAHNDLGHSLLWRTYVVGTNGSDFTEIDLPITSSNQNPVWNPSDNGELIYFAGDGLHVTYADGSSEAGSIWAPSSGEDVDRISFSPDGTKMAMSVGEFGTRTLQIISSDGSTTSDTGVAVVNNGRLAWNPTGTHISILGDADGDHTQVKIYDIALDTVTIIHASDIAGLAYLRQVMWDRES